MRIVAYSINHRTCDIKLREKLALSKEESLLLIGNLKQKNVREGLILSTCNRTELLVIDEKGKWKAEDLLNETLCLKSVVGIGKSDYEKFYGREAIEHLFRVAAGIDSMIVGDSQILGQVKEAFAVSSENDFAGSIINRLQLATLKLGKRVISETAIGEGAVSISFAAIKLIEKYFYSLRNKKVLIIGAGETAELAAVHIAEKNPQKIMITNRTIERGEKLARKINGGFIEFEQFKNKLYEYDVIISATSSQGYVLSYDEIKFAMKKRRGKITVIMDIAVPRDVEPKVGELDEVFYQDVDSLKIIIDQNIEKRKREIPRVENIILEELDLFLTWLNTLDILPTVKKLRGFFEEIRRDEYEKIKNKLQKHELQKVEEMTKRLVGRILHNPTVNLKSIYSDETNEEKKALYSKVILELFNLNDDEIDKEKRLKNL